VAETSQYAETHQKCGDAEKTENLYLSMLEMVVWDKSEKNLLLPHSSLITGMIAFQNWGRKTASN
jgi:hypothetical protein